MKSISNAKLRRNLLFCLISSIETDIRKSICNIDGIIINEDVKKRLAERYFVEHNNNFESLYDIIDYSDIGDYIQIINCNKNKFINIQLVNRLTKELERIIPTRNRVMHIRPLEIDDDNIIIRFIERLNNYIEIIDFNDTILEYNRIKENPDYLLSIVPNTNIKEKSIVKHNLPMVDYDDTGFIGRVKDKEELIKRINGPYPVITVIGVGGIGKTSLVLSCLYDILDNVPKFDTIIWLTLKTKSLSNGDFKKIKDAILDIDKNIENVDKSVLDDNISTVDDIIEYMKINRTLLIIDNYETISSNASVKQLFENLPQGSKILITSRVGVGNYEQSFKLNSLDEKEALAYFRKLSKVYRVNSMIKQKDETINKYLLVLNKNPLAIKWFVINVGRGLDPRDILQNKIKDLTDFCLSNIYEKLSSNSIYLLRIIILKKNKCSLAELLYLCELNYDECLKAINELYISNFLVQNEDFSYSILEFALNYIRSKKGFSDYKLDYSIQNNINKLNGNLDNLKKDIHLTNNYHPLSLFPRNDSERIVTLYVLKAIECSKHKEYTEMENYFEIAKTIDNDFADLYKVFGYLYSKYDSIKSEENYRIALDLTENKAPIYYFLGGSFINNQKYDMAEIELRNALSLEPNNYMIQLRYARLKKMMNKFDESISLLNELQKKDIFTFEGRMKNKFVFEMIDTRTRFAESLLSIDKNSALCVITSAIDFVNSIDSSLFDFTIYNSLFKLTDIYIQLLSYSDFDIKKFVEFIVKYYPYILAAKKGNKKEGIFDNNLTNLCQKLSEKKSKMIMDVFNYESAIKELNYGYIKLLNKEKGYGFITPFSYSYQTIFFHCSQFKGDFRNLKLSDKVSFELNVGEKITAMNVQYYEYNYDEDIDEKEELMLVVE